MASITAKLAREGLITPPPWLPHNVMFEATTGSVAYGCAEPGNSDEDIVGFAMPPKHQVFPHLAGHIPGFGPAPPSFDQFQQHHVEFAQTRRQYDVTIYSLVRFFDLCADNNPNMVDALFCPRRCVRHSTALYEHVRDHRRLFLHQGAFARFRGYAYAQLKKLDGRPKRANPQRQAAIDAHGFDTKFAYHIVRLACECEQILAGGDLVLDRDRELYKAVRRGEWSKQRIKDWFADKERELEALKARTALPRSPDLEALRGLLMDALEMHYGSLAEALPSTGREARLVDDILSAVHRYDPAALHGLGAGRPAPTDGPSQAGRAAGPAPG